MANYTYTIFDGDPSQSGPCAWAGHEGITIEADNDRDAENQVQVILGEECAGLCDADEYRVGDTIHAIVWNDAGRIVATPSYALTVDDLVLDPDVCRWEYADAYVVVGGDGQPCDCYTRIGAHPAGVWYVDDGDDDTRTDTHGPYLSEEAAEEASRRTASEQHEGLAGEDAEDMQHRLLVERAGEPDPEGQYCVYWWTVGEDEKVVDRYPTADAAEAAAEIAQIALEVKHPGGGLLCGYEARLLCEESRGQDDEEMIS